MTLQQLKYIAVITKTGTLIDGSADAIAKLDNFIVNKKSLFLQTLSNFYLTNSLASDNL